jgi:hypothetical protein
MNSLWEGQTEKGTERKERPLHREHSSEFAEVFDYSKQQPGTNPK